jgi:hypothetical protein
MTEKEIDVLVEHMFLVGFLQDAERPVTDILLKGEKVSITYLTPIGTFNLVLTSVQD